MNDPKMARKLIGSRLSVARRRAGLSQAQAAKELGIPRPSISEIEAGRRRVAADELVLFGDLYSVDLEWLAGKGEKEIDALRDRLLLAARDVSNMKPDDIEKVIELLSSLRPGGKER